MKSRRIRTVNYKVPSGTKPVTLFERSDFGLLKDSSVKTREKLYDSFDWRLYKKDFFLVSRNSEFFLYNSLSGALNTFANLSTKKAYLFAEDFPESELKNVIKKPLGIRSLIKVASLSGNTTNYRAVNKDEKTVARLYFRTLKVEGKIDSASSYLTLEAVRGYSAEFKELNRIMNQSGLEKSGTSLYNELLTSSGIEPGGYSSKFRINIDPETKSAEAVRIILKHLIKTIKINEDGIKKDIDIEFLHDFRVAIRRARSALSQLKYVFPEKISSKLKYDFSSIGKMTNRLRDLDVYLLKKEEYKNFLPEELQPGLEPIFNKLSRERKSEQVKIKSELSNKYYRDIIKDAESCLDIEIHNNDRPENADIPVLFLAKKIIWKKYKRIISDGSSINDSSNDNELHALRIECKKLRYLLEFFYSLFPSDKMDKIIVQLKNLQDNLGDFNDLYIQQQSLIELLSGYSIKSRDFTSVSISVGGLITALNNEQKKVRKSFNKKFLEFSKMKNRDLFRELFKEI